MLESHAIHFTNFLPFPSPFLLSSFLPFPSPASHPPLPSPPIPDKPQPPTHPPPPPAAFYLGGSSCQSPYPSYPKSTSMRSSPYFIESPPRLQHTSRSTVRKSFRAICLSRLRTPPPIPFPTAFLNHRSRANEIPELGLGVDHE